MFFIANLDGKLEKILSQDIIPGDENEDEMLLKTPFSRPFQRKPTSDDDPNESLIRFKRDMKKVLSLLSGKTSEDLEVAKARIGRTPSLDVEESDAWVTDEDMHKICSFLAEKWKMKDERSEITFDGLMLVLEKCLASELVR